MTDGVMMSTQESYLPLCPWDVSCSRRSTGGKALAFLWFVSGDGEFQGSVCPICATAKRRGIIYNSKHCVIGIPRRTRRVPGASGLRHKDASSFRWRVFLSVRLTTCQLCPERPYWSGILQLLFKCTIKLLKIIYGNWKSWNKIQNKYCMKKAWTF